MTTPGGRSEPQPGAPGGNAGGPRSATAATFQVNDASLRDMRKTWQGLTQDVKNFAKAIDDLKRGDKTLESIQTKLGNLGFGGGPSGAGNARPAGMPGAPPAPAVATRPAGSRTVPEAPPPVGPGYHPEAGAAAGQPVGDPAPTAGGRSRGMGWAVGFGVGKVALGAVAAQGAYYNKRMDDITSSDLLFNRQAQNTGYGYRESEKDDAREFFYGKRGGQGTQGGLRGYTSVADLSAGVSTLASPGGALSNVGRQTARNAGNMAGLRPEAGFQGAAAASANLYDPTVSNRAMSIGVGPTLGPGGKRMTPAQVYQKIVQTVFRNKKPTANQITEGLAPGAPLYMTLTQGLGLGPDAIAEFERYAVAQVNLGGSAVDTDRATAAAGEMMSGGKVSKDDERLVKKAGLMDSIKAHSNAVGAAGARNTIEAGRQAEGTLENSFDALASATDKLTGGFKNLNTGLGAILPGDNPIGMLGGASALAANPIGAALGAVGGVGGAMFAWQQGKQMFGRRRGRGGRGGGGGGGADAAGDLAESVLGAGDVQKVFVVNWPGGGFGGGGGEGGGPGGPVPVGGGRGGRLARAGRFAARTGAVVGASAAAWKVGDAVSDKFEDKWGGRDEEGNISKKQQLGKSAATVGKTAGAGAAAGAAIGSIVPVIGTGFGAAVGAVGGTVAGLGKAVYDKQWGSNKRNDGREKPDRDKQRDPQGQPRMPEMPFYSLNDPTPGGSATFGYPRGRGGAVPGNHDNDTVPIRATPGEVVVPKGIVRKYGGAEKLMGLLGFLQTAGGRNGHFAEGGEVRQQKQPAAVPSAGSVIGDTEGIHPEFMRRLKAWSAFVGQPYKIGSGYRSIKEQEHLYSRWMRRVRGQAPAAKPGSSNHNFGLASDGPHWRGKNPEKFGLRYPMSYEPWHVEPEGAKGMRTGAVPPLDLGSTSSPAQGTGAAIPPARNLMQANIPGVDASEKSIMSRLLSSVGLSGGNAAQHWARAAQTTATDAAGAAVSAPVDKASGAPSNPGGNAAVGKAMAAQRGWTGAEWDSLYQLWQGESGWNHKAANPTSSARGIPQAMMTAHFKNWKTNPQAQAWLDDPRAQIDWGLDYIQGRYKTPSKAYATWKGRNPHWYEKGAWDVPEDGHQAILHREEMVVPASTARKMREAVKRRGQSNAMPAAAVSAQGSGGRAQVLVQLTAPVTLAGRATREDAAHFVDMVTSKMEENDVLASLGGGS